MKKNLIIISGLNDNLNLEVGKLLSDGLDMFLLDLKKLLEYEIVKKNEVIEKVGLDYLQKLEHSAIKKASTFENTVIVADYDNFLFKDNYKLFKEKAIIIYIKFSKLNLEKQKEKISNLNLLNFTLRNKQLEKISDIILNVKNEDAQNVNNKIIEKLKEVLL